MIESKTTFSYGLCGEKLKPLTAEEVKEVSTVEGMRRRIQRYAHDDSLTRHVFDSAYYRGLSGEDTMTMLAYHALLDREQFRELVLEQLVLNPMPPKIVQAK